MSSTPQGQGGRQTAGTEQGGAPVMGMAGVDQQGGLNVSAVGANSSSSNFLELLAGP